MYGAKVQKKANLLSMIFSMPSQADVAVCGAGPAGLVAALRLAESGRKVILLDRRDPWREPVSCAEAAHALGLSKWASPVDPAWIRGRVDGVVFVSPDGTRIDYKQPDSGLILDRAKMHRGLAERVAAAGGLVHFRANVEKLEKTSEGWSVQGLCDQDKPFSIACRAVVDASGAGGKLTKLLPGFEQVEDGSLDLEPAVFTILEGIEFPSNMIELGFSSRLFPGGYGWVFPRDSHTANVGIVVGREFTRSHPPRKMLQQWIAERWPNVKHGTFYGGAIPCGQSRKALAAHGIFKAGDSASQVNPISRSGIVEGMKGGALAAKAIHQWLDTVDPAQRKAIEANLLADWFEVQGDIHERLHRAKKAFGSIPDAIFDKAAHRIAKIPIEKRTLPRIFFSTLIGSPMLLWRMRSLMGL